MFNNLSDYYIFRHPRLTHYCIQQDLMGTSHILLWDGQLKIINNKGGVYLRDRDAILALIFLFFIRMISFWNIVGGMGASLCIPSFMRICELLPPKLHYPEILVLLSLLTEISLPSVQNG